MSRPRIRSLKPECWQDEALGGLGPWERLLFVGAITMADDEGRMRLLPAAISGFVFPYDEFPPAKIRRWLAVLEGVRLISLYEVDGHGFIQIHGWKKHQRIEKPTDSELPAPPDSVRGLEPA